MTTRVLLTGGAGYIGSHTYLALRAAGHEVVILDNFANASEDVPHRLAQIDGAAPEVVRGDVRDRGLLADILTTRGIDAVVHFAADKAVGESVEKPLAYMDNNIGGLVALMQAMQEAEIFTLVFSSSAAVYGLPETLPIPESAPLSHANPYGYTKRVGEEIIAMSAAAEPRWRIGVLRYFNPVGAHPSGRIGEDPAGVPNNLMPYVAKVATGDLPKISVFGGDYPTPDGTGVRDYIHVCDLAEGHVLSLSALLRDGAGHVVNLGTGRGYSVLELIAAYSRACGRALPYEIVARRPGDPAASYADPGRARDLLGFSAQYDLDAMCDTSWRWVSQHRSS
jgi:UDP-glucose 4-epimerase